MPAASGAAAEPGWRWLRSPLSAWSVGARPARRARSRAEGGSGVLPASAKPFGYSLADMTRLLAVFTTSGNVEAFHPDTPFQILFVDPALFEPPRVVREGSRLRLRRRPVAALRPAVHPVRRVQQQFHRVAGARSSSSRSTTRTILHRSSAPFRRTTSRPGSTSSIRLKWVAGTSPSRSMACAPHWVRTTSPAR